MGTTQQYRAGAHYQCTRLLIVKYEVFMDITVGETYTFWFGSGFKRTGRIKSVDGNMVLVSWFYDIPDSWESTRKIC